jgi:hypothetical protein
VEAVSRGLCYLQRFSLQQFLFKHSVFSEVISMFSNMFTMPLFKLRYFSCQSIDESVDRLLQFDSLLAKHGRSFDGLRDILESPELMAFV